jgi:NhaP-type Na+/H+ or K+/H+ antiporter
MKRVKEFFLSAAGKLKPIKKVISYIWQTIDPIFELAIYIYIAFLISRLVEITFIQAIVIVFVYFLLNIIRILISILKNK